MIVTFASQKGGTGKSSLCAHLSTEWVSRGKRVLVVDTDPQGSALAWGEVRAELGLRSPTVMGAGDNVRDVVSDLAPSYDVIAIDTAGRRSKRVVGALSIADLAILPCLPGGFDLWSLQATTELVTEVQELRPTLLAGIVANGVMNARLGASAVQALAQVGIPLIGSVGRRVALAEAPTAGQGVCEREPASVAAQEIRDLANRIETMCEVRANVA